MKKNFSFGFKQKISSGIVLLLLLFFALNSTLTLAFFYDGEWGSNIVGLSGKVKIQAVGVGDHDVDLETPGNFDSIEDTIDSSNLIITLGDGYQTLVPGMDVFIDANCKVFESTTSPLLRAKIEFMFVDNDDNEIGETNQVLSDMQGRIAAVIQSNNWVIYTAPGETQAYWYYLGSQSQTGITETGNKIMEEVEVTGGDAVVDFIDAPIEFPTYVDSSYSGFRCIVKITFQAIQNYIPDKDGHKLDNTISNSQQIFKFFDTGERPPFEE